MNKTQRLKVDLSIIAAGIASLLLRFYILLSLWEWFVMPVFNVRAITVIELIGLLIGWAVFSKNPSGKMIINKHKEDSLRSKRGKLEQELTRLMFYLLLFLIGFVYWYFAR